VFDLKDWLKLAIQIAFVMAAIIGGYYKLDARVWVVENGMQQERLGYTALQSELNHRLERLEDKIDSLALTTKKYGMKKEDRYEPGFGLSQR
jgi:hypothetical protein